MRVSLLLAALISLAVTPGRASGEVNVALASEGAQIAADSEWLASPFAKGGERASALIDGKWIGPGEEAQSNRWHNSVEVPHPHWVWIRFSQPARIDRYVIHRADLLDYPVDFVAEYSTDGGRTFVVLDEVRGNRMDAATFAIERKFAPVVADNFRLRILRSLHESAPNNTQLSEIEVFGQPVAAPLKPGQTVTLAPSKPILNATKIDGLKVSETDDVIEFRSAWLRVVVSKKQAKIVELCWDSAGRGKVTENLLKTDDAGGGQLVLTPVFASRGAGDCAVTVDGNVIRYAGALASLNGAAGRWEIRVEPKGFDAAMLIQAENGVYRSPPGLRMAFAIEKTPVTVLANPRAGMAAPLPGLLHAPDFGTLLVTSDGARGAHVDAEAIRSEPRWSATFVPFDAPTREDRLCELSANASAARMHFAIEAATPALPSLASDPRLENWSRYGLNAFQYRPDLGMLANNVASDNAIFCLQMYADVAAFTPAVVGVEPMRMVRESLDRYFAGQAGYGATWADLMTDVHPTVIIAAWDVVRTSGDLELLNRWLPELEKRAGEVMASDRDRNGLPESKRTGLPGTAKCPTSNWWDQINFGHEDAYGCALAYRAFRCLADLERLAKREAQAKAFDAFADGIRTAYLPNFFNEKTGILAGWKDSAGALHDYGFTFVTGIAIVNGLVPAERGNAMIDRIQGKMKEVGFTRFDLGLPGNLIPIRKDDYGPGALGSPQKDDGSDTFGVFENGGASACFAYYYIQALYQLGRRDEADAILLPMLKTYGTGGFQNGVGHGGEWTRWDGKPSGYEGYLPDAWYSLLALFNGREGVVLTPEGFKLAPWAKSREPAPLAGLKFMGMPVDIAR